MNGSDGASEPRRWSGSEYGLGKSEIRRCGSHAASAWRRRRSEEWLTAMMMMRKKRDRTHEKCGGFKVVKLESRVIRERERDKEEE